MASVETLVMIKRGGGYLPPHTIIHGLTEDEVAALAGHVVRLPDVESVVEATLPLVESEAPVISPDPAVDGESAPEVEEEGPPSRIEEITAAIDLLDESEDFTSKGRPKFEPLTAILGFKPSHAEISAALALRGDEGL